MNVARPDHSKARNRRSAGAAIAAACVLCLMAALWLRPEHAMTQVAGAMPISASAAEAPSDSSYLHAPANAGAIPSAEQVFGSRPYRPEDDDPPAPTF